jgi:DNA-binding response OmpR family regulator
VRVLVAEDARSLADRVAEGLRDQGMVVDIARDGLEAAAKLDVNAYDVVLLDRDLPGIHGDDLCQMITSHDQRVMVLMLMLTAAGSPEDRVSGLGLGADDYLAKPFHFPELAPARHSCPPRICWRKRGTSTPTHSPPPSP